MTEKLGIFGGTFDPPHIGHQILAAEAIDQLGLEKVLWVLTPFPPHKRKRTITPLLTRLKMVEATIAENPDFELSRVDIDRSPPHYALDTVRLLQGRHPKAQLIYLMGGDSLNDLPTWFSYQEFIAGCHSLGVMRRPGDGIDLRELDTQIPEITSKVKFIDAPLLEISASQIRSKIHQGKPFRYLLPQSVYQIIQENNPYLEPS